MPYHVLSVKEKLEIIRTIENGAKKSAVAREKNLPLTTVCGIWNAREKLRGGSGSNLKRCRIRDSAFPEVEKALLLWLKKARSMNLPVSGPLLAEKALTFAAQLNCTGFACSNGWLSRFKARYSIVGKTVCAGITFEGFADADKDLELCAELTDDEIIRQVMEDSDDSDTENEEPAPTQPTSSELTRALMTLSSVYSGNMTLTEIEADMIAGKRTVQKKISDFFAPKC
ncbi:hypothetical protein HPB49_017519 [Dermacentor silvarum]|uniref:Uncharacterized protein n=1 Tax=Dermacentor silvarum TaxID=543639 RepID=A0ACB8D747_DERSI|nr:hypothetical protein HPB49_017519 [Dermacentor silvarum]